jgi:hypothetical protein
MARVVQILARRLTLRQEFRVRTYPTAFPPGTFAPTVSPTF